MYIEINGISKNNWKILQTSYKLTYCDTNFVSFFFVEVNRIEIIVI